MGLKRAKTLLANGGDTDLLEQIVKLLTFRKADLQWRPASEMGTLKSTPNVTIDNVETVFASVSIAAPEELASAEDAAEKNTGVADEVNAPNPSLSPQEQLLDVKLRVKWLKTIAEFDKFDLMVQFSSQVLLKDVVEVLSKQPSASTEVVMAKYQKGIKL